MGLAIALTMFKEKVVIGLPLSCSGAIDVLPISNTQGRLIETSLRQGL